MEIWKDIEGYEGLYQVSTNGRVKSSDMSVPAKANSFQIKKGRILSLQSKTAKYFQSTLFKEGKRRPFNIHRLVAVAFIPNPENKPCVNHMEQRK